MGPRLHRFRVAVFCGTAAIISVHSSAAAGEPEPTILTEQETDVAGEGDSAPPKEASWLEYLAAPECPGKEEILAKLRGWLGDSFEPDKPLGARARASFEGQTWVVEVELSYGDARGTRKVAVQTCSEAADFVALTIALAIEPGFQPEAPQVPAAASKPEPTEPEASNEEVSGHEQGPVARPEEPRRASRPIRESSLAWEWGAGAMLTTPPFPGVRPGASVHGFAELGAWLFGIEGAAVFPFEYQSARAENPVRFSGWLAHPRVCPYWGNDWRLLACAGAQLGSVRGKEVVDGDNRPAEGASSFWGAATLGAQLRGRVARPIGLYLGGDLVVPFVAPTFQLSGESDVEVYRPKVGFAGGAGIFIRL